MIAMLHHDLEFLVNLVILGLSSGSQIGLQIIVGVHAVGTPGGPAFVFLLVEGLSIEIP